MNIGFANFLADPIFIDGDWLVWGLCTFSTQHSTGETSHTVYTLHCTAFQLQSGKLDKKCL